MRGILADVNVGKQRRAIMAIWVSDAWRDLWSGLGLVVESFPALGCLGFVGCGDLEDVPRQSDLSW